MLLSMQENLDRNYKMEFPAAWSTETNFVFDPDAEYAQSWPHTLALADFNDALAEFLINMACNDAVSGPLVEAIANRALSTRGIVDNVDIVKPEPYQPYQIWVADALRSRDCLPATALSDYTIQALGEVATFSINSQDLD